MQRSGGVAGTDRLKSSASTPSTGVALLRPQQPQVDAAVPEGASSQRQLRRDAAYLRWRYLQCPDAGAFMVAIRKWGRLAGWSVFRIREDRLLWGDALFDPRHPSAIDVLLRHIVPSYPVGSIEAWFAGRPPWVAEALRKAGFAQTAEPQDLSVMCVPFVVSDATERIRQSLYYTMGDSDLF